MTEQSSLTSQTPSAFYDPESWCWRTSQASLLSAVPESLERLPDWGTTSGGVLCELRTPGRLTAGRDGSASLPTPVVNDMGVGKTVEEWDTWTDEMKAKHGNGNGHGPSLSIEVARLEFMPTTSPDGNEPSGAQLLTQQMIEGCDPDSSNG